MQGCAQAELSGLWRLTFALGRLENLIFFIQSYAGHPRFYSFRALGSLQFSLEHSLEMQQLFRLFRNTVNRTRLFKELNDAVGIKISY